MTERWIKLRLHRRHPKVLRLAELAGLKPNDALALAIDWFRALDADPGMAKRHMRANTINQMLGCDGTIDFATAMAQDDIAWLKPCPDGSMKVREPRKWMGQRHKWREQKHLQRRHVRGHSMDGPLPEQSRPDKHQRREESSAMQGAADASDACTALSPKQRLQILPRLHDIGFDPKQINGFLDMLGQLPQSAQFLAHAIERGREKKVANLAGYVVAAVKSELKGEASA